MNNKYKDRFNYSCDSKDTYKKQVEKLLNRELDKYNTLHFEECFRSLGLSPIVSVYLYLK